ncbi:hypothetical protein CCR75_001082 [Bremia lactucae]|uniref:Structural maintenance of chromosomes protein n=1 Tax=Bremia lactucae TaxID=4779 RepID=A0A976FRX2_BRELC|nr:hypothetical protein CCR75_001082 [Bremia lactucae]
MGRIARLELENFKSYGEYHVIGPFHRFTAVVGPNGSGKSNLMDAISFVLGVHSRQLRSIQLRDLIHRAPHDVDTNERSAFVTLVYELGADEKPPSKSQAAQTLQKEVKFTRLISEKGVGSYRLDGHDVSSETYQNQLKEIGILVKARNFLVFQGDVESIASKSPLELTKLFEQISMSDEYKSSYEKLAIEKDTAEENTIFAYKRKKGLVAEKRLVKEQKEEAEQFRLKLQAMNDLRVEHYLWQLFQVYDDMKQRQETVRQYQETGRECVEKEAVVAEMYQAKKKELITTLRDVKGNRKVLQDLQSEMEDMQPQVIRLREQMQYVQRKQTESKATEETMKQRFEGKSAEIEALKKDLQELEQAKAELDANQMRESNKREAQGALVLEGSRLEEYHRIKESVQIKTALLRNELESIVRQQNADQSQVETLGQERLENTKMIDMLTDDLKQADERIQSMQRVIAETERDIAEAEASVQTADVEKQTEVVKKEKLTKQLDHVSNKLRDLNDNKRQSQAEAKRADTLETLKRLYPGVRGRLVELCKPIQRKYNMAVTVATGKHMEAIVVNDYRTGQDCIQYLRDSRAGSAQFIPLDKIRVKPINERFRGLGHNIKMVVDVIECDAEIEPALHYAVGDTVVCDSIDVARDICFRQNEKVKAVTLNGMVVSKNGSMTGGKTQNDLRRAGRWDEKEVVALQQEKEELIDTIRAMERHGASYAKQQTLRTHLEGLTSRLTHAKADLVITETKRPKIQVRMENATKRVNEVIEPELSKYEAAVASRKIKIDALQDQIHSVEDEMFAEFSEEVGVDSIRVYEERVLKRHHKAIEMRRKITEHEAKLRAQVDYLQSQDFQKPMLAAKDRALQEAQHLKQLGEEEAGLMKRIAALRKERSAQEEVRQHVSTKVNELEKELQEINLKKTKYEERLGKIKRRIAAEEAVLERLKDHKKEVFKRAALDHVKLPTIASDSGTKDVEMEDVSESTSLENSDLLLGNEAANQEVDFSSLPDAHVVVDDKEFDTMNAAYEKRIAALVSELEQMQPNMRALDKFDAIQSRIGKEEEELDRIKQQALATATKFEEVKQARHNRFMEAFNHISGVINATYKQLTMSTKHPLGGTAYLNLENTEEPYLTGMKYNAMPPMKRFREMEELSGGEKTVAALALLFAIHNYRPSPFFVLDEVDAALDNVNVNKVSTYIAKCNFQCLVISLKDSFYEKADALVGICKDIHLQQSKSMTLDLTTLGVEFHPTSWISREHLGAFLDRIVGGQTRARIACTNHEIEEHHGRGIPNYHLKATLHQRKMVSEFPSLDALLNCRGLDHWNLLLFEEAPNTPPATKATIQ